MRKTLLTFIALLAFVGLRAQQVEIVFSDCWSASVSDLTKTSPAVEKDGVSISFAKGTATNAPNYQSARKRVVINVGNTMTVASSVGNITSIVLTLNTANKNVPQVSSGVLSGAQEKTNTWTGNASEVTFTASGASYTPKSLVVTVAGANSKKNATVGFSQTSYSIDLDKDEFTAPTFSYDTDGQISFTSSDESVATVSSEGLISLAGGSGKATITATAAESDNYYGAEATVSVEAFRNVTYRQATTIESGKDYLLVVKTTSDGGDVTTRYASAPNLSTGKAKLATTSTEGDLDEIVVKDIADKNAYTLTEEEGGYTLAYQGTYLYQADNDAFIDESSSKPSAPWTVEKQDDGSFKLANNGFSLVYGQDASYNIFELASELSSTAQHPLLYTKEQQKEVELEYAFTPADSSITDAPDSVKLWLSRADAVSYTGVSFDYVNGSDKQKTVTIEKASITEAPDGNGGVTLGMEAPQDLKKNKAINVKVSLVGPQTLDGTISAVYNQMSLKLVAPAIEATVDTLHGTDSIKVQIPAGLDNRIGVIYYYIVNATDGVTEHSGYMSKALGSQLGNGLWGSDFIQDQVFFAGKQYYISAKAYMQDRKVTEKTPLAADSTDLFNGASKAYQYSSYKLVSLTPSPDSFVVEKAEDAVIALEFDGPVAMNDDTYTNINTGMGTYTSFDHIKPMDGDESAKYAKKWEISFQSFAKKNNGAPIQMSLAAEDEQGRRVKGNSGLEATSFFDYTYECSIGTPRLSFTPASGCTVSSLKTIVVKGADILEAYTIARTNLALYDADDNKVAYAEEITPLIPASQANNYDYTPDSVEVTLNTEVITPGTYTFRVPKAFFNLGTQFNSVNCLAEEATYTIAAPEGVAYNLMPSAITPDTAKVQEYLGIIQVKFGEEIYALPDEMATDSITFVNKQTREVIKGEAYVSGTTLYVMPSAEINASEEAYSYWTLSIPQGFVFNEAGTEANFEGGNANPALVYNYTVGIEKAENGDVVSEPADGSTVESLTKITLTWPAGTSIGLGNGMISVYDASGNQVARLDAEIYYEDPSDWLATSNVAIIDLMSYNLTAGTYTLSIPEGYFMVNDNECNALSFTYTVGMATGINGLDEAKDGKTVIFTLDGKKAAKATKGLYIINGKKVMVK